MLMPELCGGGPDEATKAYAVLRSAVGIGGSARDDTGIDGLWRRSRSIGLAAATGATRRAIYNGFPWLASDLLPHYERSLSLFAAPGATQADRRQAVAALWPARSSAVLRDISAELQRIDVRFSCSMVPEAQTSAAWDGRWFDSIEAVRTEFPVFGGLGYSELAGPSSRCMLTAFLAATDPGALTAQDERAVVAALTRLRALIPSWVGFEVSVSSTGFLCGESPLGWAVV